MRLRRSWPQWVTALLGQSTVRIRVNLERERGNEGRRSGPFERALERALERAHEGRRDAR